MAKKETEVKTKDIFEEEPIDILAKDLENFKLSFGIHTHDNRNSSLINVTKNERDIRNVATRKIVKLKDAANIATDASLGDIFTVTLTDDRTLDAPTNSTNGQRILWRLIQDDTGSRLITLDAIFNVGPFTITLSTTAEDIDYIEAIYNQDNATWDITNFRIGY